MDNLLRLSVCFFVICATLFSPHTSWAVTPEQKVLANDGTYGDGLGWSVSIDGDTAVIGAKGDENTGSAYIFRRNNGIWIEDQKLTASDRAIGDSFGWSVSIDGDTTVIGDVNTGYGQGNNKRAAYVFTRSNGVWTEQQKITTTDTTPGPYYRDDFGSSVSIDGDNLVIGAIYNNEKGAAYIFTRSNGVWTEQQKIIASDGSSGDRFGSSVSINGDTAIIAASNEGAVYIFTRNNGVWTEVQKLTSSSRDFGGSISMTDDTIIVGAHSDNDNGYESGAAYIFTESNGQWTEQQKLIASDGAEGNYFGYTVSIDDDTTVIGVRGGDDNGVYSGSAYIFTRSNGVWTEQQKLIASDGAANDYFGSSVSLDDNTAVMGAWNDSDNGSTYFYDLGFVVTVISGDTSAIINLGNSVTGTLEAIDSDGLTDGTYFSITTPPLHGTAGINTASGLWFYFSDPSYVGDDPFVVTVTDDLGYTFEQEISIRVINPNDLDNDGVNNDNDAFPNDPTETTDTDSDGIGDNGDNCINISNADQLNDDGDALGNACDDDFDNDGVVNLLDAFPNDPSETSDTDNDGVGDNTDNCIDNANFDQIDFDNDTLGDACDADADNDGMFNATEDRFGGNNNDATDTSLVIQNMQDFAASAPADSDLDGVPDDVEAMLGEDNTTSTFQDLLDTLSSIATTKNVPAMGGIGLLALGLSMLGLGAVRLRKE